MKHTIAKWLLSATFLAAAGLSTPALAGGVSELPKEIQDELYNPENIDPMQPIGESAYRDFKPKKGPPWTIGYASSYAGNTWRADVMKRLTEVVIPKWQKLGLVKEVIITQSNLNDSTQIQQMRQLVDQGVDAIIVCCSNPTALNQTVEYAYQQRRAGVLGGRLPDLALCGQLVGQLRRRRPDARRVDGQGDRR